MDFGIVKCAMIQMKRGKFVTSEGIELPDGAKIRSLDDQEGYKYLGILQFDAIKHKEVKEKLKKEYARRVKKILKSRLNAGNFNPSHKREGGIHNTIQCRNIGLDKIRIKRTGQENKEVAKHL